MIVLSADQSTREAFCARVLEDTNVLLSMARLRRLLAGRVAEEQIDEKARQLLDATATKRLGAGQTVVIALEGFDAAERERYVRLAHANRRPRHLVFVEVAQGEGAGGGPRDASTRCAPRSTPARWARRAS